MFKVYLSLDGPDFDARQFQRRLPSGELAPRKRIKDGRVELTQYWRSLARNIPGEHVSQYVCMLLEEFGPTLAQTKGVTATLHVVSYISSIDDVSGLSLSPPAMTALGKFGVQFDFDIARTSERGAARNREHQHA